MFLGWMGYIVPPAYTGFALLPVGAAQNSSTRKHSRGILISMKSKPQQAPFKVKGLWFCGSVVLLHNPSGFWMMVMYP